MSQETSSRPVILAGAMAVVAVALFFLGRSIGTPFRDADHVDVDLYSRFSPFEVFTTSHLRAERVHFYRPLSDFVDALMVRAYGCRPAPYHLTLLALILANGYLLFRFASTICGAGAFVGWLAALLYVAHPLQQGTLTYFEGGCAHVTYLFFVLLFLLSMWRYEETPTFGRASIAMGTFAAAALCFDGGIVLPVAWYGFSFLVGRGGGVALSRARVALGVALALEMMVVLLLRKQVIGAYLGGYNAPFKSESIADYWDYFVALGHLLSRLTYPAFQAARDAAPFPVLPPAIMLGGVLLLLAMGARGGLASMRVAAGLLLLELVLLAPIMPEFILDYVSPRGEIQPALSYRLSVPLAFNALVLSFVVATSCRVWLVRSRRVVAVAFIAILIGQWAILNVPIGEACRKAGEIADRVRAGICDHARASAEDRTVFLLDTPLDVRLGTLSIMRVFQVGLSSSLRPPCVEREIYAYPLLADPQRQILRPGIGEALASREDALVLRFDRSSESVVPFERSPFSVEALPLLFPREGERVALESGSFALEFDRGAKTDWPVVVLINRVHPFYLEHSPGEFRHLPMEPLGDSGRVRASVGGACVREILNHFPVDPVFIYVEMIDPGTKTLIARSDVVKIWIDS